jgi:hypothetical protein
MAGREQSPIRTQSEPKDLPTGTHDHGIARLIEIEQENPLAGIVIDGEQPAIRTATEQ